MRWSPETAGRGPIGCQNAGVAIDRRYWNTTGAAKTFTHPVHREWLAGVDRDARILDYGCGYGRTMAELADHGFTDLTGADISAALIARGRDQHPGLRLTVIEYPPVLGLPAAGFDVILLFAVLTCVPADADQRALVTELDRLLAPGGLLCVSDVLLQPDERNRRRYTGDPYGVFTTGDGATCRHHSAGHLRGLFPEYDLEAERHIAVPSMNGHPTGALQLLLRKQW
ncbi:methyltransferase family protein [Actinoplanes italicus]|uniref:Methyltransferase family protein n=1 Tax=Actinoplanes italicus TaxID=113567 RepID=A0A2T0JWK0_9ACTN|nr:methyltransferase family protein [Actinoplanes italicus]